MGQRKLIPEQDYKKRIDTKSTVGPLFVNENIVMFVSKEVITNSNFILFMVITPKEEKVEYYESDVTS